MINAVRRRLFPRMRGDSGMVTSEYALGTVAACSFAAVLIDLLTGGWARNLLKVAIARALDAQF